MCGLGEIGSAFKVNPDTGPPFAEVRVWPKAEAGRHDQPTSAAVELDLIVALE
jgi:hypothetical protein